MNSLIPSYRLNSIASVFYKDSFGIKSPTKIDMLSKNKEGIYHSINTYTLSVGHSNYFNFVINFFCIYYTHRWISIGADLWSYWVTSGLSYSSLYKTLTGTTNRVKMVPKPSPMNRIGPVGWVCRIHRLLLCSGVRLPPNQCTGYDTKQSECEAQVMLELWEMHSAPLLPWLPVPL